ncbi:MAG TPA: DUF5777 family beta-barrel protein [Bacteroidia bacterium]|nr:DUF5777 family beta-barrel protein [Bacteroidia bacterium]
MKKNNLLLLFSLLLTCLTVSAQDSLLALLQSSAPAAGEKTFATFKSTKIISAQTNETVKKHNLDFRVGHLFGNMGTEAGGGGSHTLYGLDQSNDIRISFDYGITDRLMVSIGRNKRQENLSGAAKFRLMQQTSNEKIPLAITLYGSTAYSAKADPEGIYSPSERRMSHCMQMIIARKFSPKFSFEVVPSFVHRNLVDLRVYPEDKNDLFSLGFGGRLKITKSFGIIADYFHNFREESTGIKLFDPFSAGIEIETGGHVFSIMFTNAVGLLENDFIPVTTDSWSEGGSKFSFNISRVFKL